MIQFPAESSLCKEQDADILFRTLSNARSPASCPRCGLARHYELRDGRLRCAGCAHTFHRFAGRWIKRSAIGERDWLALIRLFQRGLTISQISAALSRSYNTVHKALTVLRTAILAHCPTTRDLLDSGGALRGFCIDDKPENAQEFCAECRSPVFAIHQHSGSRVEVSLMGTLRAREVLANPLARNMFQTVIYTDKFQDCDALLFSCCKTVRNAQKNGTRNGFSAVALDTQSPFWQFARPWLTQYRSIAPGTYPLYLKEIEFRFNHQKCMEDWATTVELAGLLCERIPPNDCDHS